MLGSRRIRILSLAAALVQIFASASAQRSSTFSTQTQIQTQTRPTSSIRSTNNAPETTRSPVITGTSSSSSSGTIPSTTGAAKVHTVQVGKGGFSYEPAELKDVGIGDVVTFEFFPLDHSVARAEFGSACVPYEYTGKDSGGKDKVGFWSDTQWVHDATQTITWNLTVNSTEPIFYYCAAPGSCKDHQMVGVINPNSTQTLSAQIEAARNADFMVPPNGKVPSEGTGSESGAPNSNHHAGGHKLSKGAIAGTIIGAVVFLAVAAALFFYVGRARSLNEIVKRHNATVKPSHGGYDMASGYPGDVFVPSPRTQRQSSYSAIPKYGNYHNSPAAEPHDTSSPGWGGNRHPGGPTSQVAVNKSAHHSQFAPVEMQADGPLTVLQPQHQQQQQQHQQQQLHVVAELEAPVGNNRR